MSKPIFYDPQRKRWKRLRLISDPLGILVTLLVVFFIFTLSRTSALDGFSLPAIHKNLRALKEKKKRRPRLSLASHRKTKSRPSDVALNSDEGIRAAFYVPWDEGSYSSFKEFLPQIDLLFPEWIHVVTPDGRLQALAEGNKLFDLVQGNTVHEPDEKHPVMQFIRDEKAPAEVFPLVNNFDPTTNQWLTRIGDLLNSPAARANFRAQMMKFLAVDKYRGMSLDFEEIPVNAQPGFNALIAELASDLHSRNLKLYIDIPTDNNDFDYPYLAAHSDGLVLMNYDQHVPGLPPGPVSAQDWFTANLRRALKVIPREKLIAAFGDYGYDWQMRPGIAHPAPADVNTVSAQEAWLHAHESESSISFDQDSLNPHYGYMDDDNIRHEVWYLDAVTALNEMRAARQLGINTFALWRLGSEDASLWAVWDRPRDADAPSRLRSVPPGQDVDLEGRGEILRIEQTPQWGWRTITLDPESQLVTNEEFSSLPMPFQIGEYGGAKKKVAITFDDGPDPKFTPQILDTLKRENANATFFLIGSQAEKFPQLTERIYREGHEIGNHTFTHPDISNLSNLPMKLEVNTTERLFEAKLGVKPVFFRPPYSIDAEPDTAEQVEPLRVVQNMGYITVGSNIDPNDWRDHPRHSAEEITASVIDQLTTLRPGCVSLPCGNLILLHDGGGDRSQTVRALPMIIDAVRAHGFEIVSVAKLLGKSEADVMPPLPTNERWSAKIDSLGFTLYGFLYYGLFVGLFFLGNILMTGRLLIVGSLAIFDRFRRRKDAVGASLSEGHGFSRAEKQSHRSGALAPEVNPPIAVLIPAFNEERVIINTVRSVLASEYPAEKLRVIVIDDGSTDSTLKIAQETFAREIAAGQVLILTKKNAGKAEALNYGLMQVQEEEEIFIGIDADTAVAPTAIARLVPHFQNPRIAAIAGNTKVGNRVNLWTRWQALEYITSQNFERRALNALGAVTVVPGALGAWRTAAVRAAGGYHVGTVAEDADLTMSLLQAGYRVEYEDRALAFTEAPVNADGLMRQRFRWSFGILQAVWKHRSAFHHKGVLGWFALPNIAIFQILLPVVSPLIDLMFVLGAISFLIDKHFHPATANPASFEKLVLFFMIFLVTDFIASAIAFSLERREPGVREDNWLLSQVWLQRFAYRQLFSVVLFKTLKRAVDGRPFSWDKLERTAPLPAATQASTASSA